MVVTQLACTIEQHMVQRGLSQAALAHRVGVSATAVGKWLSGGGVRPRNLPALAEELGVSVEELIDMAEEPASHDGPTAPSAGMQENVELQRALHDRISHLEGAVSMLREIITSVMQGRFDPPDNPI